MNTYINTLLQLINTHFGHLPRDIKLNLGYLFSSIHTFLSPYFTMEPDFTNPDRQPQSPFFSVLPPEVRRMIYTEVWRHDASHPEGANPAEACGLKQHIIRLKKRDTSGAWYTHTPCVVSDQTAPDSRSERLAACPPASPERETWCNRVESEWAVHWPCEELYLNTRRKRNWKRGGEGSMPPLLTCKLMYIEALPNLYTSLTFVLTDVHQTETFLSSRLLAPHLTRPLNLELSIRIAPILPELYAPGPPPSLPHNPRGPPLSRTNNPWSRLCSTLSSLPNLRQLSVWLDLKNLSPWGEKVYEQNFLAELGEVRLRTGGKWTLALPRVDDGTRTRRGVAREAERERVAEEYLTEEETEGMHVPYRVVRGDRPNYWEAHLSRVRARTEGVLMIEGPPGV